MGNIGKREKYYLMLLGIICLVALIYFFGIRNLGIKYDELVDTRNSLQSQLDYLEALKTQNDATQAQINQLKTDIANVEGMFLPDICAEAMEQYVLKTFENAGCPYLVSATAEDVSPTGVTLPDGSAASDALLVKRITVQYCTTDGFNIAEYNRNNSVIVDGVIDEALWTELQDAMVWQGTAAITGYDQFLAALETIEAANPDCVKIYSIGISSEAGYVLMDASIDFYSATFNNRVSDPDTSAPYVTWSGDTTIATDHGFIGRPFIFDDPNSLWYNIMMVSSDAINGDRPFSTYWSDAIFQDAVNGTNLETVLNLTDAPAPEGEPVE